MYYLKILEKTTVTQFPKVKQCYLPLCFRDSESRSRYDHPKCCMYTKSSARLCTSQKRFPLTFSLTVLTVKNGNTITGARMPSLLIKAFYRYLELHAPVLQHDN